MKNIEALDRELADVKAKAEDLFTSQMKTAEAESRLRTDDEKAAVEALMKRGRDLRAQIDDARLTESQRSAIADLTKGLPVTRTGAQGQAPATPVQKTLGQQFIESEAGEFFKKGLHRRSGAQWSSPTVEIGATTLDSGSGSGGQLIIPDYRPGILPLLFKRLVIADLLAPGTTESTSVKYMRETTFTNAAAPVTEQGVLAESTLAFDVVTDEVEAIGHWLPVTDEMLADVNQIRSYIDARLRLGLDLTEEDQLLNGSGTAPAIRGLMNRTGLTTTISRNSGASETNIDAIFRQIVAVFVASFVQPEAVVINPTNWQTIQLSKDTTGNYLGTGPFAAPQAQTLWGLPVAVTPSITANTALVGAFRSQAQVFRKGGISLDVSNSHADFFVKRLQAIRAVERLALAVYRPAAFGKVDTLN